MKPEARNLIPSGLLVDIAWRPVAAALAQVNRQGEILQAKDLKGVAEGAKVDCYIGIMEKKWKPLYYIRRYRGYIGIMEKKMEPAI